MAKALLGVALLMAATALVVAVAAFREARGANEPKTVAEVTAAGVRQITDAGNRITPAQVVELLGKPDQVYRNNPRALCWRYVIPYTIEICWGPKRQRVMIGHNIPPQLAALPFVRTTRTATGLKSLPFASLPHGWYEGMPRDVRKDSRIVGRVGGHRLAVAPTRNGNFCLAFQGLFAGCRVRSPALIGSTYIASAVSVQSAGGSVLGPADRSLYVRYADRTDVQVRLTHVGAPINASFFYIDIPRSHWVRARRALSLELRDGRRVIERTLLPRPNPHK
jgi:hypothetical protein